jgi:ATP-binding cassette subfamily B (MDR/TAP) protein 1
VVDPAVTQ